MRSQVHDNYELPLKIVSDQDPKFTSLLWQENARALNTKLSMSTASHAQTDGQTEVVNWTMEIMLRAYVKKEFERWATLLSVVRFSLYSSPHSSSGFAPFERPFGRLPRFPLDVSLTSFSHSFTILDFDAQTWVLTLRFALVLVQSAISPAKE